MHYYGIDSDFGISRYNMILLLSNILEANLQRKYITEFGRNDMVIKFSILYDSINDYLNENM